MKKFTLIIAAIFLFAFNNTTNAQTWKIYNYNAYLNYDYSKAGIGTAYPAYKLHVVGDIYAQDGWLRTNGARGWHNETYGGGMYMTDNTWIRTYGNKSFYHNTGTMRTDGTFQVGPSGNRFLVNTAGKVGIGNTNPVYKLHVTGDIYAQNGWLRTNGSRGWYNETHGGGMYMSDATWIRTYGSKSILAVGNIRTEGRHLYFGANQYLYGDNSSALYYSNNHSTVTQLIMRDKENKVYGRLYGDSDGANFGLLDGDGNWSYLAAKDNYTDFRINNLIKMRIKSNGNIGIGTTNPQSKLAVNGTVTAKTVITTQTGWADFVFDDDYKLPALKDVEKFIIDNKHLPGVKTEKEILENGNNLGETDAVLLQKIEELTLYMIETNNKILDLQKENSELKKEILTLKNK